MHESMNATALPALHHTMARIKPLLDMIKIILVARGRLRERDNVLDLSPIRLATQISEVFFRNPEMYSKMLIVLQPLELDYNDDSIKINDSFSQTLIEVMPLLQEKFIAISARTVPVVSFSVDSKDSVKIGIVEHAIGQIEAVWIHGCKLLSFK